MKAAASTQTQAALVAQDDAHYQSVLRTLVDQGAALAARIAASATAASTPDTALPDASIAFDRAARTVRRTIALARHIASAAATAAQNPVAPSPDTRTKARTRLIRAVEDAIHRQHRTYDGDREALDREFAERLEDPALEFDLAGRDIDDVIQEICQDLGIAHPTRAYIYRRRTPQDVADLRTRAAAHPIPNLRLAPVSPPPPTPLPDPAALAALLLQT